MDTLSVAFLGLGAMGLPMAQNIAAAGFPLRVWNRTAGKTGLVSGASAAGTPAEASASADVVVLCLPTEREVADVLGREDGVLAGARAGTVVVDTSTIDPAASRALSERCAERALHFLEAPLSGGTIGARNGTLTLMIGGSQEALERARPVLAAVGTNLFYVGGPGAGQTVKLCNQMIFAAQMVAVAEAFALLGDAQIDPALATQIFRVSTADCTAVRGRVPVPGVQPEAPASNGWQPGFATKWMAKDLALVESLARTLDRPVMQAALDHQYMRLAMQAGFAEQDLSALGAVLAAQRP